MGILCGTLLRPEIEGLLATRGTKNVELDAPLKRRTSTRRESPEAAITIGRPGIQRSCSCYDHGVTANCHLSMNPCNLLVMLLDGSILALALRPWQSDPFRVTQGHVMCSGLPAISAGR